MDGHEVTPRGCKVRRQFERSRLERELFESVYELLLAPLPPTEDTVRDGDGTGVAVIGASVSSIFDTSAAENADAAQIVAA